MPKDSLFKPLMRQSDVVFTFALFGIIMLLILPIAPVLMDGLLALSIGLSLLVLLIVVYLKNPAEFTVFPTLLLTITLFRLGLNVASTRLILLEGYAGNVIDSFGNFVVQGNYVVGAVVFLILVVVNFVVITKGAGRIAEVAARFTLDAMPGKQMAIDAELNAGLVDETKATQRRMKIQKEADFYGAMDGASKFVRGDAVAGLLITVINVVGGITIGVVQKGMPLIHALQRYTLLSIGDGLVSQIPSLIVSIGAGMLITRTSESNNLGEHFRKQLFFSPKALKIVAAMLIVFGIMPGMPFVPFTVLGLFLAFIAYHLHASAQDKDAEFEQTLEQQQDKIKTKADEAAENQPAVFESEIITLELGYNLISFNDKPKGGDLADRVQAIQKRLEQELGLFIPKITIKDNIDIDGNKYRILLHGKELASHTLRPNALLAIASDNEEDLLPLENAEETQEPVFNIKAWWVKNSDKETAELKGYTLIDPVSILITHLSETLKHNAHLLLGREDTQRLLDAVKVKNPTLISELLPDLVNVGLIQHVLKNLLKEGISLKQLPIILEAIGDFAPFTKHPDDLSEQARRRLSMYFVENYIHENYLSAVILEPKLENELISQIKRTQFEIGLFIEPSVTQELLQHLTPLLNHMTEQSLEPIVLTSNELRLAFKRFFEPSFPNMIVLSYQELPNDVKIRNFGILKRDYTNITNN